MVIDIDFMKKNDLEDAALLERQCFSDPWSITTLENCLNNPRYTMFAARDEGRTIGYIGTYMAADELNIANIAVSPRYRRMGIGESLLRAAIQRGKLNGASNVYLEVRVSNEAAISLYRKLGFENAGIRKNFYENPTEDGRIMNLYLDE